MSANDREAEIAALLLASQQATGSEPASNYIDHFRTFVPSLRNMDRSSQR